MLDTASVAQTEALLHRAVVAPGGVDSSDLAGIGMSEVAAAATGCCFWNLFGGGEGRRSTSAGGSAGQSEARRRLRAGGSGRDGAEEMEGGRMVGGFGLALGWVCDGLG